MIVGVFFGILIGISGLITLILPARRYLKTSLAAIIREEYSINRYIEEEPEKGILKGELEAEEAVKAPFSSKECALFKVKEKTRTYHSSGGSKKTTDRTYFRSEDTFLEAGDEQVRVNVSENTELRLSNTIKERVSMSGEIPRSLQKLREGNKSDIVDSDHTQTVENPRNRNLEFLEKPVQTGTEVNLLFDEGKGEKKLEKVSLLTDREPRKVGLKLLPKALLLTGIGLIFLTVGIVSLTWI